MTFEVSTIDEGSYLTDGGHDPSDESSFTGEHYGEEKNSFFLFDLSGINGSVNSVTFEIELADYFSSDASEIVEFYDVGTDLAALRAGQGGTAAFADLGSGRLYGSAVMTAGDVGHVFSITLSAAAIEDIQQRLGGQFAIGAHVSSLEAGPTGNDPAIPEVEGVYFGSTAGDAVSRLILDVTPAPSLPGYYSQRVQALVTYDILALMRAHASPILFYSTAAQLLSTVFVHFDLATKIHVANAFLNAIQFRLTIGSLDIGIDTDNDGAPDTQFTIADPVPNLSIDLSQDANGTFIAFTALAAATDGNDTIAGTDRPDYLTGGDGNDRLDGGASSDALSGGNGDDVLIGGTGSNALHGDAGNDILYLQAGGTDIAKGGDGNDGIYFGAALDASDRVDGGAGTDTLAIQGNVGVALGDVTNVEVLLALSGSDTRFGDTAGNRYDYHITTSDSNVAAGAVLTVQATGLLPGEDLRFDGSAESDGGFRIFAGQGVDSLKGGAGSDGFFFGSDGNLTAADRVDGGGGIDTLALRGNYAGPNAIVFTAASFSGIEVLALLSSHSNEYSGQILATGFDYDVTLADGNVAAGQLFDVNAARLGADESLRFDGRAETDGSFRILSGAGNDTLYGGAGNDTLYGGLGADRLEGGNGADLYVYRSAAESTSTGFDTIAGFDYRVDRVDLPGDAPAFSAVVSHGSLSGASFDDDLAAAMGNILGAGQSAIFTPDAGDFAGRLFAIIDGNGQAGYQAGQDYVIEIVAPVVPLNPSVDIFV